MDSIFIKQAKLMLRILPIVVEEKVFALKGGTAINFFVRDMPRLSVDIDLVYLPLSKREDALIEISQSLSRIALKIKRMFPGIVIAEKKNDVGFLTKLIIRQDKAVVKIEPNLVLRGSVYPVETRTLVSKAQDMFEMYLEAPTLSIGDLYGGKICAALDRQHPRDFFDIKVFFEHEKFTDTVRKAFIVYLISHNRPMIELLNPRFYDFRDVYDSEFKGMVEDYIEYKELVETRYELVKNIKNSITHKEKQFIVSVQDGDPMWELLGLKGIEKLPAVKWKLLNVKKMNPVKRKEVVMKLQDYLGI